MEAATADDATAGSEERTEEVEWQFDAPDLRAVEQWLADLPSHAFGGRPPTFTVLAKPPRRLVDRYMDTEDWRLARAGLVLRTRRRGRRVEVTMKDLAPASADGLRHRLEVTEPLGARAAGEPGARAVSELGADGPVGRRVAAVAGGRPLLDKFEVRTRRLPFSLRADGIEVAEVAIDDTTVAAAPGAPRRRLQRVEVEIAGGSTAQLAPLVEHLRQRCGLVPAAISKFDAGLQAAGLTLPGAPDLGSSEVAPDAAIGDLASAVVRRQVGELVANDAGTRLGEDIEALHDMRVATRRLRAALELFGPALPARAQALRRELGWLADVLGAVRDLDVHLARLEEMTAWTSGWTGADGALALAPLRALLVAERADARQALLAALDSPRHERTVAGLVSLVRADAGRRPTYAATPAAVALPALVRARHDDMVRAARRARRSGVPADYHRLRIRGKRLRYALEFAAAVYGNDADRFVKKLTAVQEQLGSMQDAEVAAARLFALATAEHERTGPLPAATVFLIGGIAEKFRRESDELRHDVARTFGNLDAKAWKKLDAAMSRRQKAAAAGSPRATSAERRRG